MDKPKDREFDEVLLEMLSVVGDKISDFQEKLANHESIYDDMYFDLVDELSRVSKKMERMAKASKSVKKRISVKSKN